MIKVKEFIEGSLTPVDGQINDFLKHIKGTIIDIKYQVVSNDSEDYYCALLIYKGDKNVQDNV